MYLSNNRKKWTPDFQGRPELACLLVDFMICEVSSRTCVGKNILEEQSAL